MSAQQVFHWLPGPLAGLGASVNLTLQKSEAETGISWHPQGYTLPLMETPEAVANVQIFWRARGLGGLRRLQLSVGIPRRHPGLRQQPL